MSGFNHSSKYYYRYQYYNNNVKYSVSKRNTYNDKYSYRYDYYFLHYNYSEKNENPFSFENKEDIVNDTKSDLSKSIVPFRFDRLLENKKTRL